MKKLFGVTVVIAAGLITLGICLSYPDAPRNPFNAHLRIDCVEDGHHRYEYVEYDGTSIGRWRFRCTHCPSSFLVRYEEVTEAQKMAFWSKTGIEFGYEKVQHEWVVSEPNSLIDCWNIKGTLVINAENATVMGCLFEPGPYSREPMIQIGSTATTSTITGCTFIN